LTVNPESVSSNNPNRLPGITPTFDAFTRAVYGWIRTDKKKAVDIPDGERIIGIHGGIEYPAVIVDKSRVAGVTVHVIEKEVDRGEIVQDIVYELDPSRLTIEGIRTQNYERKRQLLPRAMLAYIHRPEVQQLILQGRQHHYVAVPAQAR